MNMIKKFEDIFEHYDTYSNKYYLMNKVSDRMLNQVANVLVRGARDKVRNYAGEGVLDVEKTLQELCRIVYEYTDLQKTINWGEYFIIEDYKEAFRRFALRPFPRFMDAISKITLEFLDGTMIKELNEVLSDHNFGYRIRNDVNQPWISVNPMIKQEQE